MRHVVAPHGAETITPFARIAEHAHPRRVFTETSGAQPHLHSPARPLGWGIMIVKRPSGVVKLVMPSGEPFGLADSEPPHPRCYRRNAVQLRAPCQASTSVCSARPSPCETTTGILFPPCLRAYDRGFRALLQPRNALRTARWLVMEPGQCSAPGMIGEMGHHLATVQTLQARRHPHAGRTPELLAQRRIEKNRLGSPLCPGAEHVAVRKPPQAARL